MRKNEQGSEDEDEDEDEETLQLELQAIEARLKLKRLQHAKARKREANDDQEEGQRPESSPRQRVRTPPPSRERDATIQVPVSPSNHNRVPQVQRSPARVMLGIDKGLRAEDVSLKRARGVNSQYSKSTAAGSRQQGQVDRPKKSFSERIAESRASDRERQERQDRLRKSRSQGFHLPSTSHDNATKSIDPFKPQKDRQINGEDSASTTRSGSASLHGNHIHSAPIDLQRSESISNPTSHPSKTGAQGREQSTRESSKGQSETRVSTDNMMEGSTADDSSIFEPYSGLHISKRQITHNVLTRAFEGKEIFNIPRLLKTVKSPNYDPPDIEGDYVIFGIIASKSTPYDHRTTRKVASSGGHNDDEARPKFMVLKLTDLKWELDLYLFDSGFETFWKLTVGTVIALLNPGILPPRNRDTGAFSLKVTSSEDTVLELGKARDLGFCKSVKRDGAQCGTWVDRRSTEHCEFHVSMLLERTKAGRMEVNGMTGFGKGTEKGKSSLRGRGGRGGGGSLGRGRGRSSPKQGEWHDKYLHETMFISRGSAAKLLDAEDTMDAREKADHQRRRQADIHRETELARKLASTGSGTGKEYLQVRRTDVSKENISTQETKSSSTNTTEPRDAASLGLLGNKASEITLSPVKRGRTLAREKAVPMGWGGASKRGLLDIQSKQASPSRERSPSKKKARFMLDQGIRQPGRESLGTAAPVVQDDDDLEIV